MGLFDPPAIALRKRLPSGALTGFNVTEEFALHHLYSEPAHRRPYQLGVVLALWIKAGERAGEIDLPDRDSRKVQAIYESCMRVLRGESCTAFSILIELAEQDHMFGVSPDLYRQLSFTVMGVF